MKFDIGCGRTVAGGFVGVDISPGPAVTHVVDIANRYNVLDALGENTADELRMSHVLEHFEGREALKIMETLWMVAKDGCKFEIRVPYGQSNDHWRDPDHKRPYLWDGFNCFSAPYWGSDNTGNTHAFGYTADWKPETVVFYPANHEKQILDHMGPGDWWMQRAMPMWNCIREMRAYLVAVKPARAHDDALSEDFTLEIDGYR